MLQRTASAVAAAAIGGSTLLYRLSQQSRLSAAQNSTPVQLSKLHMEGAGVPGEPVSATSAFLDQGAKVVQNFHPVNRICEHVCGFHFYNGDMDRQVEAHHYCSHLNEDFRQCVVYDSDKPDARLIGIEYIISEKLFMQLPPEERIYWHSHQYEVKGGIINMPKVGAVPELVHSQAEQVAMTKVATTYGKTFHFWDVDRGESLPMGPPKLMMAFTQEGQIHPRLLLERDRKYGTSTKDLRRRRENISTSLVIEGADHWNKMGDVWKVQMVKERQEHHK